MAYRFMLNTNVISDLIPDPKGKVARQLGIEGESSVCSCIIAAHALSRGLALVTDNVREFNRVRGLSVVNWRRLSDDFRRNYLKGKRGAWLPEN